MNMKYSEYFFKKEIQQPVWYREESVWQKLFHQKRSGENWL